MQFIRLLLVTLKIMYYLLTHYDRILLELNESNKYMHKILNEMKKLRENQRSF
jgi:hypothetical protein